MPFTPVLHLLIIINPLRISCRYNSSLPSNTPVWSSEVQGHACVVTTVQQLKQRLAVRDINMWSSSGTLKCSYFHFYKLKVPQVSVT